MHTQCLFIINEGEEDMEEIKKMSMVLAIVSMLVVCTPVFVERAKASGSHPFSDKADYNTNFNLQSNDNCTVTLNGWTETYVTGWDGTKSAYLNEGSTGTDKAILKMKTPNGADITDAKGAYFEFKVTNNYANVGAGSLCLLITNSYSSIYFGFYPGTYDFYIRYTDYTSTPSSRYFNIELQRQYLNSEYHRMFAHFNNATGVATFGIDDKVYSLSNIPRSFVSSSVYLSLLTTGHPGIVIDNMKAFREKVFPMDDYMQEYYPEFKIAYPENNYDFTYSPMMHADQMTYNMTKPIFDFFNSYGISVSQTYFYNYSANQEYDSECLVDEVLRNYAISKQSTNGIYTHSLKMNTNLKTAQVAAILAAWKNLVGSYPLIWVDHGALPQNVARYGSDTSSQYYIGNLRNASCLTYAWANYENLPRIPIPYGYYYGARDSLKGFLTGSNYGLVYDNEGATDLFTSGQRVFSLESTNTKYDYYTWELANKKTLALEHTYQQYYLYKNINGIKYTKLSPPPGYSAWNPAWNLHYKDATSPWTVLPEYATVMNNIQTKFTVNSGLGHLLVDRGAVYNSSSVVKSGNTIYVNTPSEMKNVTIYTRTNQSGKALERDGNYYPFTKGFYSWGATIPSNMGYKSYNIVNWNKYIGDNGQIGRMEFQSNKNISIHFKKSGSLTFELKEATDPVCVRNMTNGSDVDFIIVGREITFNGGKGCEYLVDYTSGGSEPPEEKYTLKTTARCRIISNGGVNVNISVYDEKGDFVANYGPTCDVWLDKGYTIDFGDFDATPLIRTYFGMEE